MTEFGDATDEDSYDPTAPADPEATARIFLLLMQLVTGDDGRPDLDDLHPWERAAYVYAFARLLARLRREGSV